MRAVRGLRHRAGIAQRLEHQPSKLRVASSNLVSRSTSVGSEPETDFDRRAFGSFFDCDRSAKKKTTASANDQASVISPDAETECSGNVTKENIARLTNLGVDYISSGALTHSAPILDVSLKNLHPVD